MALTQSGRIDFVLSYPSLGGSNSTTALSVGAYTRAPSLVSIQLIPQNSITATPPWDTVVWLTVASLGEDGSGTGYTYNTISHTGQLSLDIGSHSMELDIVGGDIYVSVDDWQIDVSGAGASPRHGTPFLSHHISDDVMLNGTLVGSGFTTYPLQLIAVGEEVPMTCFPTAPGEVEFIQGADVAWDYHPEGATNAMGLFVTRFIGTGGAFWTNRYLATES